jgi:hypothetical protein
MGDTMARRTGIPSIIELAKRMCDLIIRFQGVIRLITNNDPIVEAALQAALAACDALANSLGEYREVEQEAP